MKRRKGFIDMFLDEMAGMPLRVNLWLGVIGYVILMAAGWSVPQKHPLRFCAHIAWLAPCMFGASALLAWKRQKLEARALKAHESVRDLKGVTWREFERLVSAYYRAEGFMVTHCGGGGPDGGVDVVARRGDERWLIQCKRYNGFVGVAAVRELFGVVMSQGADRGVLVTTGEFSPEAMAFGISQPRIELVNGKRLAGMVKGLRGANADPGEEAQTEAEVPLERCASEPDCPLCGGAMRRRVAKNGPHPGLEFWGCERFPHCKGKRYPERTSYGRRSRQPAAQGAVVS